MWQFVVALAGAVILGLLAVLHFYWAFGGRFGKGAVVPERHGVPLFRPSRPMTVVVGLLLCGGSVCLFARLGLLGDGLPRDVLTACTWLMAAAFLLRSVGDFRYVGVFKRVAHTRFAYWDTRLFVPICLLLFAACVCAAVYGG